MEIQETLVLLLAFCGSASTLIDGSFPTKNLPHMAEIVHRRGETTECGFAYGLGPDGRIATPSSAWFNFTKTGRCEKIPEAGEGGKYTHYGITPICDCILYLCVFHGRILSAM